MKRCILFATGAVRWLWVWTYFGTCSPQDDGEGDFPRDHPEYHNREPKTMANICLSYVVVSSISL